MNVSKFYWVVILMALFTGSSLGLAIAAPSSQADGAEGVQVLTRGPVHEAFAQTITFDPEPGIVVAKAPPPAIEELPPDQKPDGANLAWIPGYWGWDDERNNFLWVSGLWRDLPPNRQWVPGYWNNIDQGAQWISGYWADSKLSEVEYLPEPPATAEAGPNVDAPSQDSSWIPGSWVWQQSRYTWRPGFWANAQANWVWVPAHYMWSPRGYVFNDGYWDYSVGRRGLLFAPVYFSGAVYAQQGFSYSPSIVINPAVFSSQLFLRPQFQHYYFGDYYAANYATVGFVPWFAVNSSRSGYDPIFAQQRWERRQDRAWEESVQADFRNRRDHEEARPPRTLAAQQTLMAGSGPSKEKGTVMAASLEDLAKSKDSPIKLQPLDKAERQKLSERGKSVQTFRDQRQKLESKQADASAGTSGQKSQSAKMKLPQSPIVAKAPDLLSKDSAPPKTYETPKPDLKVEAKQRVARSGGSGDGQATPHTMNRQPLETQQQPPKVSPGQLSPTLRPDPPSTPTLPPEVERQQQPSPPKVEKSAAQSQSQFKGDSKEIPNVGPNGPPKAATNEPVKGGPNGPARTGGTEPPQGRTQKKAQGESNQKPKAELKVAPPGEPKDAPKARLSAPPKAVANEPAKGSNVPPRAAGNEPPQGGNQEKPKGNSNEKPKAEVKVAPPGEPKDAAKK